MKKIILIILIIQHSILLSNDIMQDLPIYTDPKPTLCPQDGITYCVASSFSMLMKYWAKKQIVPDYDCKRYQRAFKNELNTKGDANYIITLLAEVLENVAKDNLIDKKNYKVFSDFADIYSYNYIRMNISYSQKQDIKSPWDRPVTIILGSRNVPVNLQNHAFVGWGCQQTPTEVYLVFYNNQYLVPTITTYLAQCYKYRIIDPMWKTNNDDELENNELDEWFEIIDNYPLKVTGDAVFWWPEKCDPSN